ANSFARARYKSVAVKEGLSWFHGHPNDFNVIVARSLSPMPVGSCGGVPRSCSPDVAEILEAKRDGGLRGRRIEDLPHKMSGHGSYENARFIFSIASSISPVFLYPIVTASTPATFIANLSAACRSS